MKNRTFRPSLEQLESRLTPSAYNWIGITSADWNTATNWSPATVPGANDTAVFGQLVSPDMLPVINGNGNPINGREDVSVGEIVETSGGFKTPAGVPGQLTIGQYGSLTLHNGVSDWNQGASIAIANGGYLNVENGSELIMDGTASVQTNLVEGGSGNQGQVYVNGIGTELILKGSGNITVPLFIGKTPLGTTAGGSTMEIDYADGSFLNFGSSADPGNITLLSSTLNINQPTTVTAEGGLRSNQGSMIALYSSTLNLSSTACPSLGDAIAILPLWFSSNPSYASTANLAGYLLFQTSSTTPTAINQNGGNVVVNPVHDGNAIYGSYIGIEGTGNLGWAVNNAANVDFAGVSGSLPTDTVDMPFEVFSTGTLTLGASDAFVDLNATGDCKLVQVTLDTFADGSGLGPSASGCQITCGYLTTSYMKVNFDSTAWGAGITAPFPFITAISGIALRNLTLNSTGWTPPGGWDWAVDGLALTIGDSTTGTLANE